MRPIEKANIGDSVSLDNSQGKIINYPIHANYSDYGQAKMPLVGNIGQYCSYCESFLDVSSINVEHMSAKSKNGSATDWNNFLLCCKVCNSVKGTKLVDDNFHWPHINNTFLSFVYDCTGRVKVNPNISPLSQRNAQNLLDLTHLNRYPQSLDLPSEKDYRWKVRYESWNIASRYKNLFLKNSIEVDDIIEMAKTKGHWSIWFTVFKGIDEVLGRLISDFPGTCESCFDKINHYEPICRNLGKADPV